MPAPLSRLLTTVTYGLSHLIFALTLGLGLSGDVYREPTDLPGQVRAYTRGIEFDFIGWTLNAIGLKLRQASVDDQLYLAEAERGRLVREYFALRGELNQVEGEIATRFADPATADPTAATAELRARQIELRARMAERQSPAEAVLAEQLAVVLGELGLTVGGQPFPPVAFRFTPLPLALVVSPRNEIRQASIQMIEGDLPLDQQVAVEDRAAAGLEVSTFVTPVGGIGTYPAMVAQSADLNWIANVTAHEWAHNYLTLRPLGALYDASPELRTLNESTAQLVGDEVGALVMARFYPDLAPPPRPFQSFIDRALVLERPAEAPRFDFRAEMRITRVRADELLAAGRVAEAEAYMEQRRQVFWDNGYRLRKLNQAYFAFYGAYNASPGGGASGADPIGPAVRLLRRRSASVAEFLNTIAWYTTVRDLRLALGLPVD